mmetsp:Transcript_113453/g.197022  ORF Transcript_113453/g.197022 Transcript_113453/m.197022 type:complete len:207 (-) Transcript_113453:595-1215(-)
MRGATIRGVHQGQSPEAIKGPAFRHTRVVGIDDPGAEPHLQVRERLMDFTQCVGQAVSSSSVILCNAPAAMDCLLFRQLRERDDGGDAWLVRYLGSKITLPRFSAEALQLLAKEPVIIEGRAEELVTLQSVHDPLLLGQSGLAQLQQLLGLLRVCEDLQVVLQAEDAEVGQVRHVLDEGVRLEEYIALDVIIVKVQLPQVRGAKAE